MSLKVLATIQKMISLLPFVVAALIGGITAGVMVKTCSKAPPLEVKINMNTYETELSQIRKNQDSIRTSIDTYEQSLRYLSDLYAKPSKDITPGR